MIKIGTIVIMSHKELNIIHDRFIVQSERAKYWKEKFEGCTGKELDLLEQPYGYGEFGFPLVCRYCLNSGSESCLNCKKEVKSAYLPRDYHGCLKDETISRTGPFTQKYGSLR